MEQTLYPICCGQLLSVSESALVFRTPLGKRCAFHAQLPLILSILQRCTGLSSAGEIARAAAEETGISAADIQDAIDDLVFCGVLTDSHEQMLLYHSLTVNPPRYPSTISLAETAALTETRPDYVAQTPLSVYEDTEHLTPALFAALRTRHSCRDFRDLPVELGKLFALCKAACGWELRPIASAGGLFPLSLYFLLTRSSGRLSAGAYQYDPEKECLLLLSRDLSHEAVQYALNDTGIVFGAPCIFFVCGDLRRNMWKYSNRGYRYTLLEAGHAVQNMTLAAGELGLGGVEYGGFCDEAAGRLLGLPDGIFPLACYAVGYEDIGGTHAEALRKEAREKRVLEGLTGSEVLDAELFLVNDERLRRSNLQVMVSRFQDARGRTEFGTGAAPAYGAAYAKSVMESCERYTLSRRYADLLERGDRLDRPYLDPNVFAPYTDAQLALAGFSRFRAEEAVEWLRGRDLDGNMVYIPADLCFDTAGAHGRPCHIANSSGCAAHFDLRIAEDSALLELIERNALVRNWLYRQTPERLEENSLPDSIRQRLRRLREDGIPVVILSLPCEYAYSVLVCSVRNDAPPYFVSGAAASFGSVREAAQKALDEWELSYVLGGPSGSTEAITPERVMAPMDHGMLYRNTNCNQEIAYLLTGEAIRAEQVRADRLADIRSLSPVFLTYRPLVQGAFVVRAFSKALIPINFGYKMDFYSHPKVNQDALAGGKFPHYFA